MDREFEYVRTDLSAKGFKNVVKRHIKMEMLIIKMWIFGQKCPIFIEPGQWAKLCEH